MRRMVRDNVHTTSRQQFQTANHNANDNANHNGHHNGQDGRLTHQEARGP